MATNVVYEMLLSRATTGRDFYIATPVNCMMMIGYAAMQSMVMIGAHDRSLASVFSR